MKTRSLLILGAGLSAFAALPGHSQTSSDAALEAQCRATEVSMPDSCPCTVTKAREVGLNDTELASLFKDDGHAQPVDQGKYGRFWQVKSQCIADTMMASLGVSQGNPLPGIPAHMRPKMPGAMPPPPAAPAMSSAPAPQSAPTRAASAPVQAPVQAPFQAAAAASTAPASVANGFTIAGITPTRTVNTSENGDETIELKYALQGSDFYLAYGKSLEDYPGVLDRAFAMQTESLERAIEYDGPSNRSYRDEEHTFWGAATGLGRLSPIIASGYTNNRPAGQFLYSSLFDTELGREIKWSDVFGTRVWNGAMREHYCAGLQAERLEKDTWENSIFCPEFSSLAIEFKLQNDGSMKLSFAAYNGVAGSYAEGPYETQVPLTASLLKAVQPAYRDIFANVTPSSEQPLIRRAGRKHYPAPHYVDRDTVNLDFDYTLAGGSPYSGLTWELTKRGREDFAIMSARADEMIASGERAPIKFAASWNVLGNLGKRVSSIVFQETFIVKGRPEILPEREGDYIFWDNTDNKEVTLKDIFPRDWNTTIPTSLCSSLNDNLAAQGKPRMAPCPTIEDMQISFMEGMDANHFLSIKLLGDFKNVINGGWTIPVTREMKARANPKYRDAIVPYIQYDDF